MRLAKNTVRGLGLRLGLELWLGLRLGLGLIQLPKIGSRSVISTGPNFRQNAQLSAKCIKG